MSFIKILYVTLENGIQGLNEDRVAVRTLGDSSVQAMECMSAECKVLFEWDYPLFTDSSPLYHLLLHFKIHTRVLQPLLIHSPCKCKRFWVILHIQCLRKGWLHRSSLKVEGKWPSFLVETIWVNSEKERM